MTASIRKLLLPLALTASLSACGRDAGPAGDHSATAETASSAQPVDATAQESIAWLKGDVDAPALIVESGATVQGFFRIGV